MKSAWAGCSRREPPSPPPMTPGTLPACSWPMASLMLCSSTLLLPLPLLPSMGLRLVPLFLQPPGVPPSAPHEACEEDGACGCECEWPPADAGASAGAGAGADAAVQRMLPKPADAEARPCA